MIILMLFTIVVLAAGILIYFLFYKRRVNKVLASGAVKPKRLLSPLSFSVCLIIVVLIVFGGISVARSLLAKNEPANMDDRYFNAVYNFDAYNKDEMSEKYLSSYSIDENEGYTKYTEKKGDILFTFFIRNDSYDTYHPSYLIFVQYTGRLNVKYYGLEGDFLTSSGSVICGKGFAGPPVQDYFMVIGNTSIDCSFSLEVAYYDSETKGEKLSDGAAAYETLIFYIPMNEA